MEYSKKKEEQVYEIEKNIELSIDEYQKYNGVCMQIFLALVHLFFH